MNLKSIKKWASEHKEAIVGGLLGAATGALIGEVVYYMAYNDGYSDGFADSSAKSEERAKSLASDLANWITEIVDNCGFISCTETIQALYGKCPEMMHNVYEEFRSDRSLDGCVEDAFYNNAYVKGTMKLVDDLRDLSKEG